MKKWKLTGNYGTFEITKIVEADSFDAAWVMTGIMVVLEAAGWTVTEEPDGESWSIEEVD